jgi:SurA N-terminal domain
MRKVVRGNRSSARRLRAALFMRALVALSLLPFAFCLLPCTHAQEVVDRMVAVVNGSELITYSDLLWQLALQPDAPLDAPRREDLRRALDLLISQHLISQEATKLPHIHANDKEIQDAQTELINRFPSHEEFQRRLDRVGLTAEQFREIIHDRLDMENYLNFRFRSFVVVTPKEVEDYYRDVYVPRLRRQSPGRIVSPLKDVYNEIQKEITERRVESDTDDFLDQARAAAQITILDPSLAGEKTGGR